MYSRRDQTTSSLPPRFLEKAAEPTMLLSTSCYSINILVHRIGLFVKQMLHAIHCSSTTSVALVEYCWCCSCLKWTDAQAHNIVEHEESPA